MLTALVVAACFAALIAFYSVLVRNATFVDEELSGVPLLRAAETAPQPADMESPRKAA